MRGNFNATVAGAEVFRAHLSTSGKLNRHTVIIGKRWRILTRFCGGSALLSRGPLPSRL